MKINLESIHVQVATILELNPSEVELNTQLDGGDKWDSFSMLAIVALITQQTGKQVTIQDVSHLSTVAALVDLLNNLKAAADGS